MQRPQKFTVVTNVQHH